MLKLALVQMKMVRDAKANVQHAEMFIRKAAKEGAALVCLPELFHTLYFPQIQSQSCFDLAESVQGESVTHMAQLAQTLGVFISVPIFEKRGMGLYHNSAVIVGPDGNTHDYYQKMHIPDDPGFFEKYYFTPGDVGATVMDIAGVRVSTLICWDQWFPEAARLATLQNAGVLLYPTAIGWNDEEIHEPLGEIQRDAWVTINRSHAIANGLYVVVPNRVGREDVLGGAPLNFWGTSLIVDPMGQVLAKGSTTDETILFADIDMEVIETQRRAWPFLRDRRIDAYSPLTRRFQ